VNKLNIPTKTKLKYQFNKVNSALLKFSGSKRKLIGEKIGAQNIIFQAKNLKRKIVGQDRADTFLNIAFITLGGSYGMYIDYVIAEILRARGHHVHFYIDDAHLPIFEGHDFKKPESWSKTSNNGYFYIHEILKKSNISFTGFSEIELMNDAPEFPDILEASLLRHYRVGTLSDELFDFYNRQQLFEKSILISASVGQEVARSKYDRVIINHGLYSSTGPARRMIQNADIPVITHDRAKRKNTFNFTWNQSSDKWDISDIWEKVKDTPLTKKQNDAVDNYIQSRIKHTEDRLVYNFGDYEKPKILKDRLGLEEHKPIYTLFTNVLWDAASSQREIAFENPIEWVIKTIEWFRKHQDKQLIVKIHPAEVVIGTKQPFLEILKSNLDYFPKNVRIIPPDEIINSWSVLELTDLGIVHTTTAGMEMPLIGVPVCVVSHTHYRKKGFTIDIENEHSYFHLLQNFKVENYDVDEFRMFAKRYAYWLFEAYQYRLPIFYEPKELDVRAIDIDEEGMKQLIHLAQCIEKKHPVLNQLD